MTFKLYRVVGPHNTYYNYSINDLAGCYADSSLSALVERIISNHALVLREYINLVDYLNDNDDITYTMTSIFTKCYYDDADLRANLYIDLQQQFPEEFV